MMAKLQEMQQKADEAKQRLENITVEGKAMEGQIVVTCNGNRKIINVQLDEKLMNDKEQLEDMIILATNRALEKANNVNETEMKSAAQGIMPNIPGLG